MLTNTMQTRWLIRTAIQNYWAFGETTNAHTFIATPATINNGEYAAPTVVTFECEYIVEQNKRDLPIRSVVVERAGSVLVMRPSTNGHMADIHVLD